jgi:pimeloyl-ACP methyl ester carboxylesterase
LRPERLVVLMGALLSALVAAVALHAASGPVDPPGPTVSLRGRVALWKIRYRAHNGVARGATLVLPRWYGPRDHPPLPLVISPHGRGRTGLENAHLWGSLPAAGRFAVISPDGQGRRLGGYSWGSPGQIDDLARMPGIVAAALPWVVIDRSRVYAFGGSMGGQETLLLLARHPHLLAGAAAFDAVSDFALQYRQFDRLRCNKLCLHDLGEPIGRRLRGLARTEIGGSPVGRPLAWRQRSPITYSRAIAASCVPLQLWWSPADRVVVDQQRQSGRLFWRLRRENPLGPISAYVGFWIHSHEMRAGSRLPLALAEFGLLPSRPLAARAGLHIVKAPAEACAR